MSTDLKQSPDEEARDLIADAIRQDGRDQKDIAAQAGMSGPHLTNLKRGSRKLTHRQARKLARTWPHLADKLLSVAERVEDADSLPPDASSIDSPGWRCLVQITRRIATASRTRVPHPTPA